MRRRKGSNEVVLNVRKLESLKAATGQDRTEYWDVGLRGFGVRVAASGRRTFTVRYVLHGKQLRADIGVYQQTTTYVAARAEAERIISDARNGRDPFISSVLLKQADISSFAGLCKRYLEDPAAGRKGRVLSEATRTDITRIIDKEMVPIWGQRDPNSIQPEEIDAWVRGIAAGRGRKKPVPYVANRCFDYMSMVYSWAIRRRLLRYKPFIGLEKPFAERKRTRTFSNDELRRLFQALKTAPKQIAGLWLLLFYTGNRLRETLKMEWAWIDEEKKYLVLPGAVTKNKRDHLVPLIPLAWKVLQNLKELAKDSPHVFPGPRGKAMNWVQKACGRIMSEARIEDGRHHDTRRVLQTNMAELHVPPHIADMILNHAIKDAPTSRQHYDMHHYIPEKHQALKKWADKLTRILGYNPNDVLKAKRISNQGKNDAQKSRATEEVSIVAQRAPEEGRRDRTSHQGRSLVRNRRDTPRSALAGTRSVGHKRTGSSATGNA